ncbi:MAG: aminotransferase class I/II-fold pyridoxal phosphate-dependent enzyme, partial [Nanoarchaeota archaeon]
ELQLPDATIGRLLEIASQHKNIISISVGEPDFETPKPLLQYLKSIISKNKELNYPHYSASEGRKELREAIAKKLKKDNKINANPNNIIITSGSQEAIFTTLISTLDVNEQVIIPNPAPATQTHTIIAGTPGPRGPRGSKGSKGKKGKTQSAKTVVFSSSSGNPRRKGPSTRGTLVTTTTTRAR